MTIYAIFLNEPDAEVWKNVREKWEGRHFVLTENLAFVAPGGITTTAEVASVAGIGGDTNVIGLVFEWGAHHGFNRSDLWEWSRNIQS